MVTSVKRQAKVASWNRAVKNELLHLQLANAQITKTATTLGLEHLRSYWHVLLPFCVEAAYAVPSICVLGRLHHHAWFTPPIEAVVTITVTPRARLSGCDSCMGFVAHLVSFVSDGDIRCASDC